MSQPADRGSSTGPGGPTPPRSRLPPLVGLGLAAVLLLAGVSALALSGGSGGGEDRMVGREEAAALFVGLRQEGSSLGKPSVPVSAGLFIDLQCRSCSSWALRTLPRLVDDLVRPGRARLVLHHFSLGSHPVTLASLAAVAAGRQGRQWQYAYLFLRNIRRVPIQGVSARFLRRVAGAVPGLDLGLWERDRRDPAIRRQLDADDKLGADLRLPAEPAVTVSGERASRKLTRSPSATRIAAAVRAVERSGRARSAARGPLR